ncbi:hypothetical protein [Porphyrobacter sp. AAP60]|uniref:hypothetical protein n=1 Tax=Porphyrobacter sp. AAP60 TaxID=1523423 RepID=UPI0006B8EE96|nr:hypothetical protein [Porphyrobacter sp. AAP60]KPF63962.1 hypothetical protein IP79_09205 [Porphyrobacter sp. AAP60]
MSVLYDLFGEIRKAVEGQPNLRELRILRDTCDSQSTLRATADAFRGINDPDEVDSVRDMHRKLIRALEEKIATTTERRDQAKVVGIGVGTSVAGGGVVAAISIAVPAVALIPIVGGAYCVWRGSENAKALTSELALYIQLKDAAEKLVPTS